jgi:FKBP-type peptidyl-prolyl cis-trans isomerase
MLRLLSLLSLLLLAWPAGAQTPTPAPKPAEAAKPAAAPAAAQPAAKPAEAAKPAAGTVAATPAAAKPAPVPAQPAATPEPQATIKVKISTSLGDILVGLDAEKAPLTVENFTAYMDSNYYNGTVFHRVIKGFMIQGGGFTPEMDEKKEGLRAPIKNEGRNGLLNKRGTLAMARTSDLDSATSQFFINVVDNDRLSTFASPYTVFGKVLDEASLAVVDKIANAPVAQHKKYVAKTPSVPRDPIVINSITYADDASKAAAAGLAEKRRKATEEAEAKKKAVAEAAAKKKAEAEAKAPAETEKFIADWEAKNPGKKFQKTASGLYYAVVTEGTGPSPKPTDTVTVHYRGTKFNGEEFDSSYKRNKPTPFVLNQVIKGWTEGVGLMKVGGKSMLICPPSIAYGDAPEGHELKYDTLVFEVELLSIDTK